MKSRAVWAYHCSKRLHSPSPLVILNIVLFVLILVRTRFNQITPDCIDYEEQQTQTQHNQHHDHEDLWVHYIDIPLPAIASI
jgi:hypothetical protein